MISEQLKSATGRAFLTVAATGVVAALLDYQRSHDWQAAMIYGILIALTPLATRAVGEGMYDTRRAELGQVQPSDVTGRTSQKPA